MGDYFHAVDSCLKTQSYFPVIIVRLSEYWSNNNMKIKALIWQEDGIWCASVPALPGCHTWGESYEQLLEMLQDSVQGWLEVASQETEIETEKELVELSL
jgi:predicted RNase H-like HicB family nuclease